MWISIDQATKKSGIAYWEGKKLLNHELLNVKKADFYERLALIRKEIKKRILKNNVDYVLIEGIQLESIENQSKDISVETFRKLAMLQGVLVELFIELNVDFDIVRPSVWKSKLNIFHNSRTEQKKEAMSLVYQELQEKVSEDEADAICIGLSHITEFDSAW